MSVRDYKSNIPFPKNIKCQSKCTHGPQSLKWVSLKSGANANCFKDFQAELKSANVRNDLFEQAEIQYFRI